MITAKQEKPSNKKKLSFFKTVKNSPHIPPSDDQTYDMINIKKDEDRRDAYLTSDFALRSEKHLRKTLDYLKDYTVFVLTRLNSPTGDITESMLWRSTDYGISFQKANLSELSIISSMQTSKVNRSKLILTDTTNKRVHITEDTGETWSSIHLDFTPSRLVLHPNMADWMLAYSLPQLQLYVSDDFGKSWRMVQDHVTERFYWAVPGQDVDLLTVHMEIQDFMGTARYRSCIVPNCDDNTHDAAVGTIELLSLIVENQYIFVQKPGELKELYVSYNRGPFKKSFFPVPHIPQDYNIISTEENQVFLVVDHATDIANLYLSDTSGQYYTLSLENVMGMRFPGSYIVDMHQVQGIPGVYIVNKFTKPRGQEGALTQTQTVITFDKGGHWDLIPAPNNSRAACTNQSKCYLHFHLGSTSRFFSIPFVVSKDAAPGLIMAHGMVGEFLTLDTQVFISSDAGVSWFEAPFHGNYQLNLLDQGGAITAIIDDPDSKTNEVHFSCTEGATWETHQFSSKEIHVNGVVNEPGINTLIVSILGHTTDGNSGWLMARLDFSSVLTRKCDSSDYTIWSPTHRKAAKTGSQCILGQEFILEKRIPTAHCYYGSDYNRVKSTTKCQCQREDFQCDFGYILSDTNTCKMAPWFNTDMVEVPCINEVYNKSSGYRKIAADACQGGSVTQYENKEAPCPELAPKGLSLETEKWNIHIPSQSNITFYVSQEMDFESRRIVTRHNPAVEELYSRKKTNYSWDFGDGSPHKTIQGFENASRMVHMYKQPGQYNVTVTASNNKGSSKASITIQVEDAISGVLVEIPWGAQTGRKTYFNVTVLGSNNKTFIQPECVHYAWIFENKVLGLIRTLTWQDKMYEVFTKAGVYALTLEVYNSVSSIFYTQQIHVYDDITTVRLSISPEINSYNISNLQIRQALVEIFSQNVAQILEVPRSRLTITIQPIKPVVVDVTVLPAKPPSKNENEEEDTDKVVDMLIHQARQKYLSFPLFTQNDFIKIVGAEIVRFDDGNTEKNADKNSNSISAAYIIIPVALAAVIIVIIVVCHYKKRIGNKQRYSLILNRRMEDLNLVDDDPPLNIDTELVIPENSSPARDGDISSNQQPQVLVIVPHHSSQLSETKEC
ncbi:hypothetical protein CHS0354_007857 [Potamilus streckersoni]|uniref:PKD domain-containing protein n=1 Tax=Potamilus streckersoni TaxID=2493646 RepID=A0AAE0SK85_9BIVA|nr:hypothetical protein CHS0354_007857 [Potamilus streckersoni]